MKIHRIHSIDRWPPHSSTRVKNSSAYVRAPATADYRRACSCTSYRTVAREDVNLKTSHRFRKSPVRRQRIGGDFRVFINRPPPIAKVGMGQFVRDDPPDKFDRSSAERTLQGYRSARLSPRRHAHGDTGDGAVARVVIVHDERRIGHQILSHQRRQNGNHLGDVRAEPFIELKRKQPGFNLLPHENIVCEEEIFDDWILD